MKGIKSRVLLKVCAGAFGLVLVISGLALILPVGTAFAQATHGLISGTVVDAQGGVVPAADVTVKNQLTTVSQTLQTNDAGYFVFPEVLPGVYTVSVEKKGFQKFEETGINILPADRRDLGSLQLQVGSTVTTVTVAGTANPVQTTSSVQSGLLTNSEMAALPSVGRDYMALVRLLPGSSQLGEGANNLSGVTAVPQFNGVWDPMGVYVGTNGVMASMSNYSWDNNPTTMENIEDVKVLVANYEAQYGKVRGAIINVATKSGTTKFHGGAYYYARNEDFNANDFFNNRLGAPRPRYRYNFFGGTLGGPIWGPGPFKSLKDKLFFFFAYDNEPNSTPAGPRYYTVPTAMERQGDFSQSYIPGTNTLYTVLDPLTGKPFPGNTLAGTGLINPTMQEVLSIFPLPNFTNRAVSNGQYNFVVNDSNKQPTNMESLRIDYAPADKWRIFGRWMRTYSANIGRTGGYSVFAGWQNASNSNNGLNERYELNVTTTINPHMVNVFAIGHISGAGTSGLPKDFLDQFEMPALGINLPQTYPKNNPYNLLPAISFNIANAASVGYNSRFPNRNYVYNFSIADDFTYINGNHQVKLGFYTDLESFQIPDDDALGCYSGCFSFNSPNPNNPFNAGNPYAEALLGYFDSYTVSTNVRNFRGDTRSLEWYVQDNWRPTRKLSLNYGLRFDRDIPPAVVIDGATLDFSRYSASDAPPLFRPVLVNGTRMAENPITSAIEPAAYLGYFVPGVGSPDPGAIEEGSPGWRGLMNGKGILVAPRLGFAYDVSGNGKTAIRGGVGYYYGQRDFSGDMYGVHGNPPNVFYPTQYYGSITTFTTGAGLLGPSSMYYLDRTAGMPYTIQWTLGIQRQIGFLNSVLGVAYVANAQHNGRYSTNLNEVPYGAEFLPQNQDPTTGTPLPDNYYRPYPGYSNITDGTWADNGNYNSLQVSFNRKFARHLSYGVSYTWSKTLDDNRGPRYLPGSLTYGPAYMNMPNRLTADWVWGLPKASGRWNNLFSRSVLDGWQFSGTSSFISGEPQSVSLSTTNGENITGGGDGARVIVTGNAVLPKSQRTFNRYFNTSVYALPAVGTIGNQWTPSFYGPGMNDWDFCLMKNFLIKEKVTTTLRFEGYNVFNHTQFSSVNTGATFDPATGKQVNTAFGQLNGDWGPRIVQFAVRFTF